MSDHDHIIQKPSRIDDGFCFNIRKIRFTSNQYKKKE